MPSAIAVPYSPARHAHEHRAGERLRLALDVAADEHDRADLGERRADRGDRGGEHADARLAQRQQRRPRARDAPNARAWSSSPSGSDCTAAAVSAATIGNASTAWARITPSSV